MSSSWRLETTGHYDRDPDPRPTWCGFARRTGLSPLLQAGAILWFGLQTGTTQTVSPVLVDGTFDVLEISSTVDPGVFPKSLACEFKVVTRRFRGTGVVLDSDGLVAVTGAIFERDLRAQTLGLRWADGETVAGQILGQLRASRLALIAPERARKGAAPSPEWPDRELRVVEILRQGAGWTYAVRRGTSVPVSRSPHERFDVAGASGTEGGAVYDQANQWMGLLMPAERSSAVLMIPASRVRQSAADLRRFRKSSGPSGWIGAEFQTMPRSLKRVWGLKEEGPVVTRVQAGSPASDAGLRVGDVLVEMNGWKPDADVETQAADLADRVRWLEPGSQASIRFLRGQETGTASITVGRSPGTLLDGPRLAVPRWGIEAADLTSDVRDALLISPTGPGVVLSDVLPGSEAWIAGLRPLDIVLEVDGTPTPDLKAFRGADLAPPRPSRLLVERRKLTRFVLVNAPPSSVR
jgi:serine protease Do